MENNFYVYEWYNLDTEEVFYVGKGCRNRYKNTSGRNKDFLKYIEDNRVSVRIIKKDMTEEEAFLYEKILSELYKEKGQCFCNLAPCGKGGCHFPLTQEMKKYWSKNNPMKAKEQRERMKNNNPMYDKEIAKKNGLAHKRPVSINGITYDSRIEASKIYGVSETTISDWCKKGVNSKGEKCFFPDGQIRGSKKGTPIVIDGQYYSSIAVGA